MNLPSNVSAESSNGVQRYFPSGTACAEAASAFLVPQNNISPFEFRAFTEDGLDPAGFSPKWREGCGEDGSDNASTAWPADAEGGDATVVELVDAARQQGFQEGEEAGRRMARAEMEAEAQLSMARDRERLVESVKQFGHVQEKYFAEVEQQIVKLALAIAARVLHRETALDPLLLSGVVRVALEKMADRSGVVLRAAAADVAGWEQFLLATESSERPRVAEDARLMRGECVLDTTMGTVELGVSVQLEEIEKGFFDLLNHRPGQ